LISVCSAEDEKAILNIINKAATAYRGVIPADRYHEPYMPLEELRKEMAEMKFFGYQEAGHLVGIAGYQPVKDVTLIRHVYVLPNFQRKGIGEKLLNHIIQVATTRKILVGTWSAATWAIGFYEKHGFKLRTNKDELLRKYWKIPERQIEVSVVLGIENSQFH
jgi:GNAT superfamily N-acetyltransferase